MKFIFGVSLLIGSFFSAFSQQYNIILGRPTDTSITASIMFDQNSQYYFSYGVQSDTYISSSATYNATTNIPDEVDLRNLLPNTRYYYRLNYRLQGALNYSTSPEYTFHTQRIPGSTFSFDIESDEHLYDKKGVENLYRITLNNQAKDNPDFMLTLGDIFGDDHTWSTITNSELDTLHRNYRPFLGSICHSIPFYVCLGNHEGERNYYLTHPIPPNNLAINGTLTRKKYYPNPFPNTFYSGNPDLENYGINNPENYYSWTWGDALFVVLDVYRYDCDTSAKPHGWDWTLGLPQYLWLKQTLESSTAKYKFIFSHHIRGEDRGGITNALTYEWGGYQNVTQNGSIVTGNNYTFRQHRDSAIGWVKPIHQLFKDNHVSIFFQGHDHLYAHEVLDSIVYQEVPMAADSTYEIGMLANASAYVSDTLDGTGHLRVTVSSSCVKVDYVKAYLPSDTISGLHHNGEIGFSYTIGSCSVSPPANCTFNYADWSGCSNGIQTRSYTAIPIGCVGAPPADSIRRSCNTGLAILRSEMLGQPTNNSILVNAFFSDSVEVRVEYGIVSGNYTNQTNWQAFAGGEPTNIILSSLQADTKYFYRLLYRSPRVGSINTRAEYSFHTQRSSGQSFSFVVQADPHMDEQTDSSIYSLTLKNELEGNSDFMIDLGDFLMTDKLKNIVTNQIPKDTITYRSNLLRSLYEQSCHSVPLFIALGNHEGESGWNLNGTQDNIAVWGTEARKKYFLNPGPSNFYKGDTTHYNFVGQRNAYYSWKWGDALFIVLDPYWSTTPKPDSLHGWRWTLGKAQYDWLKFTLESSQEKFKFIFAHQIIGGDPDGRGGVEFANRYEWGGNDIDDSTNTFAINRPGWYKPIKELLAENHVNIFFHGHDHFFGKQEKDCLVYQETPQPGHPNPTNSDNVPYASTYGYHEGVIQASSGYLKVNVSTSGVSVNYIRTYLPANEDATHHNKDVSATYFIGSVNCYDSANSGGGDSSQVTPILWNTNYVHDIVYPNPFANQVNIEFTQDASSPLYIFIYNSVGQLVNRLFNGFQVEQGKYRVVWDGRSSGGATLANGAYFFSIKNTKKTLKTGKIILSR